MEIAPAKTGLAAAAHGGPRFYGGRARGLRHGRTGAHAEKERKKIVRYFAVGGLALRLLVGSGGMA